MRNFLTVEQSLQVLSDGGASRPLSGLFEGPLEGEVRSLADDTESAVRFLVACVAVDVPAPAGESMN